ncbi:hypothetical protein [Streptomyces mirabilis]|uniref:hypothetical protein n=1 Tax=Streptomyces mirabilis TaxID=68239 RepID=UPI003316F68C
MDEHGHPALIDIEGLLDFDAAWEHVFLRQRFHGGYDAYAALRADGLAGPPPAPRRRLPGSGFHAGDRGTQHWADPHAAGEPRAMI